MKKIFVTCLLGMIALCLHAQDINGRYVSGSRQGELITGNPRPYTEIGVQAGEVLEITLDQPAGAAFNWTIDPNNTSAWISYKNEKQNLIRVSTPSSTGEYFWLYVTTGNQALTIKVWLTN